MQLADIYPSQNVTNLSKTEPFAFDLEMSIPSLYLSTTTANPNAEECSIDRLSMVIYQNRELFVESSEFKDPAVKPGMAITVSKGSASYMDNSEPINVTFTAPVVRTYGHLFVCFILLQP